MQKRKKHFPASRSRANKARLGATGVADTPLAVRATGIWISEDFDRQIRKRLTASLGKFADCIERLTVRFEDINGPRGGVDIACRAKAVLSSLPSVVVSARAKTERVAFGKVAEAMGRAVRKSLDRAPKAGQRRAPDASVEPASRSGSPVSARNDAADPGSYIGRRVGRGAANLEAALERPEKRRRDVPVDTSAPGVSATDRKAGGESTARRNTKARVPRATATLEDSRKGRPSRKSTRKSANRAKSATNIQKRVAAKLMSSRTRARQAQAKAVGATRKTR